MSYISNMFKQALAATVVAGVAGVTVPEVFAADMPADGKMCTKQVPCNDKGEQKPPKQQHKNPPKQQQRPGKVVDCRGYIASADVDQAYYAALVRAGNGVGISKQAYEKNGEIKKSGAFSRGIGAFPTADAQYVSTCYGGKVTHEAAVINQKVQVIVEPSGIEMITPFVGAVMGSQGIGGVVQGLTFEADKININNSNSNKATGGSSNSYAEGGAAVSSSNSTAQSAASAEATAQSASSAQSTAQQNQNQEQPGRPKPPCNVCGEQNNHR